MQIGQLELNAQQVTAKVVLVQVTARLVGLPGGLGVFICLVQTVRKGHGFIFNALAEAVGENLIEYFAFDALRRLKVSVVDGDLPALTFLPAHDTAVVRPAHDAPEVGVEVKIIEVQSDIAQRDINRKMILKRRLAVKVHAVVHGHIKFSLFSQYKVRVDVAKALRDTQGQVHGLPCTQSTEGLLEIRVIAVEQTRQNRSFLSEKSPGSFRAPGPDSIILRDRAILTCSQVQ